jgi:uncharacterized protein (DUF433 family)
MTEISLDIQSVLQRIDALERELKQLRQALLLPANNPAAQPTDHPYIERVPKILSGEPIIKNTRTPVRAIVEHYLILGDTPDEIASQLPYLRLAQIFDALSYYEDHREEIDKYIEMNRVPVND